MSSHEYVNQKDVPEYVVQRLGGISYLMITELKVEPPVNTLKDAFELTDAIIEQLLAHQGEPPAHVIVAPNANGTVSVHVDNITLHKLKH